MLDFHGSSCNFISELHPSIAELRWITFLDLSFNKLTSLPDEIGTLTVLQELSLGFNSLTALPESIDKLTQLTTLKVQWNSLELLSERLYCLTSLHRVDLTNHVNVRHNSGQMHAGGCQHQIAMKNQCNLEHLVAGLSSISDANRLFQPDHAIFSRLHGLSLHLNELYHIDCVNFVKFPALQRLVLDGNNLSQLPIAVLLEPIPKQAFSR